MQNRCARPDRSRRRLSASTTTSNYRAVGQLYARPDLLSGSRQVHPAGACANTSAGGGRQPAVGMKRQGNSCRRLQRMGSGLEDLWLGARWARVRRGRMVWRGWISAAASPRPHRPDALARAPPASSCHGTNFQQPGATDLWEILNAPPCNREGRCGPAKPLSPALGATHYGSAAVRCGR